jgi:crotonobetainyl-CoA:carnitine CoA-transferase CaiB-like acyl-CoA transferase
VVAWRDDPRLASRAGRDEHASELEAALTEWFASRTTHEAVERLSDYSIPAAPVNTLEQAATSPQLHEREVMVEVPDKAAGSIHVSGKVIKFSRTPMVVGPAPTVGQHTYELLRDVLGYSPERVQELKDEGAVADGDGPIGSS